MEELCLPFKDRGGSIIVIDDFQQQLNKYVVHIFTVLCHHYKIVVLLLVQNLFPKAALFRDISLNANYCVIFKNPRDGSQILPFARQFMPGESRFVLEAFTDATKEAHSYALFDSSQSCSQNLRIRSNILPHQLPMKIYMKKCVI